MFSLVDIGYLQCLFKYTSRFWEVFLIGQIFFYSGGLGANRNVSGKLDMKLAIGVKYSTVISVLVFLFDLILYVPSTIFQLNRDVSSLVEPVLC